jgi:hypothetical protein
MIGEIFSAVGRRPRGSGAKREFLYSRRLLLSEAVLLLTMGGAVGFAPSSEIEIAIIAIGCIALTATFLFASAILTPGRPAFWWTVAFSAAALFLGLGLVIFRFGPGITLPLILALSIFGDGIGTVALLILSFYKGGRSFIDHR